MLNPFLSYFKKKRIRKIQEFSFRATSGVLVFTVVGVYPVFGTQDGPTLKSLLSFIREILLVYEMKGTIRKFHTKKPLYIYSLLPSYLPTETVFSSETLRWQYTVVPHFYILKHLLLLSTILFQGSLHLILTSWGRTSPLTIHLVSIYYFGDISVYSLNILFYNTIEYIIYKTMY